MKPRPLSPDWMEADEHIHGCAGHAERDKSCPDTLLWRTVIDTIIQDATQPTYYNSLGERHAIQRQAKHWLLRNNKDFEMVCSLASISPSRLRKRAEQLLTSRLH